MTIRNTRERWGADFGVGQGDWQSTKWVGNDVTLRYSLTLTAGK